MNHRNMNPGFRTCRQHLIVLAEPAIAAQPTKGALHHPPLGQHFKAVAAPGTFDHPDEPAAQGIGPLDQRPAIHPVSPDQLEPGEVPLELGQHQLGSLGVLEISGMNHYHQQQSQGVHYDMALVASDLLACIVAPRPPFSVVLTVWLSMMAALGVGSLPSAARPWDARPRGGSPKCPRLASDESIPKQCPKGAGRGVATARGSRCAAHTRWRLLPPAGPRCGDGLPAWLREVGGLVPPIGHQLDRLGVDTVRLFLFYTLATF
jgi:hypothetical protein